MKNKEFTCSQCGSHQNKEQNFCGTCGHKLENICPGCDATNPPYYKFCGQCGKDLRIMGKLTLDRTGLITELDPKAASILHAAGDNLSGKPFSIFVGIGDRAAFYSCWNTALSSSDKQELEIRLSLKKDTVLSTRLILKPFTGKGKTVERIHLELEDITDTQKTSQQLAEKERLLDIVTALTEAFHPANRKTRRQTIYTLLEKIGKGLAVQSAFISRIDAVSNLLFTEFTWQQGETHPSAQPVTTLSLKSIHPVLDSLQNGINYIIEDFDTLSLVEAQLWKSWLPHMSSPGSIGCALIYREHHPVGVIGLVRTEKGTWPENILMLMQLCAQLISETLPKNLSSYAPQQRPVDTVVQESEVDTFFHSEEIHAYEDIEAFLSEDFPAETTVIGDSGMQITPVTSGDPGDAHPVFATDDGVYALQCPECHQTELVAANQFEQSGWVLSVTCLCGCSFRVIREMRKVHRKQVQLSGSFGRDSANQNTLDTVEKWSAMEVTNISKKGLNFTTPMTRLLRVGDSIQLKFQLDNSTRSLINKAAMIKSVRENNVGCQFQDNGKQDTTLGFYFL